MDKMKDLKETVKSIEPEGLNIMAALTREVENVVAEAGEAAGREAEQELERILGEYERKTKQIMLKIREGTKSKTAEIAGRLSEAIMLRVEQASAKAVSGAVAEFGFRTGELTRKMQQSVEKEAVQTVGHLVAGMGGGVETEIEKEATKDEDIVKAKSEEAGREDEPSPKDDSIELQQPIEREDFNQWLSQ